MGRWVGVFFFSFVDERERGGNGAAPTRVGRAGLETKHNPNPNPIESRVRVFVCVVFFCSGG